MHRVVKRLIHQEVRKSVRSKDYVSSLLRGLFFECTFDEACLLSKHYHISMKLLDTLLFRYSSKFFFLKLEPLPKNLVLPRV